MSLERSIPIASLIDGGGEWLSVFNDLDMGTLNTQPSIRLNSNARTAVRNARDTDVAIMGP